MDKIVVANLKNNFLYKDALVYAKKIEDIESKYNLIIAPGNLYLSLFRGNYELAAQNISEYEYICTGEETPNCLKSLGVNYVFVGHGERRQLMDDEYSIEKKALSAINNDMNVIYFIGEDKKNHPLITKEYIKAQIKNLFDLVEDEYKENVIFAFEPFWSVGSNDTYTCEEIIDFIKFIKEYIYNKYNIEAKVLYGGSVNEVSFEVFIKNPIVDGVVISSYISNPDNLINLVI